MHRLLILEESHRRLAARLPGEDRLAIEFAGAPAGPAGQPTIAWYNHDLYAHYGTPLHDGFTRTMLDSPALQWVQSSAAGLDGPVFRRILEKGARLSSSHAQAPAIAEFVMAGVLDHYQDGPDRRAARAARAWRRAPFRELHGSRWLIVGFGAIGQRVAGLARAFGCHVTAVRRDAAATAGADATIAFADLADAMPHADVVVLCVPLAAATRGLVDAPLLACAKPGSMLVNVGRGGLVDEAALLAALDDGRLAHALLDVFATEPLPADSPFWDHPKVAPTPHASGMGSETGARNDDLFIENLHRFLAGEPLLNPVSRADLGDA